MYTIDDFQPGDRLILTQKSRHATELRSAVVNAVTYKDRAGRPGVTYGPRSSPDMLSTGQGWFLPEEVGAHPYGFTCAVRNISAEIRRARS
jgi:hypothetical protein